MSSISIRPKTRFTLCILVLMRSRTTWWMSKSNIIARSSLKSSSSLVADLEINLICLMLDSSPSLLFSYSKRRRGMATWVDPGVDWICSLFFSISKRSSKPDSLLSDSLLLESQFGTPFDMAIEFLRDCYLLCGLDLPSKTLWSLSTLVPKSKLFLIFWLPIFFIIFRCGNGELLYWL